MKIALYTRKNNPEAIDFLTKRLDTHGINTVIVDGSKESCLSEEVDVVLSVGGDGTLLSSVHLTGGTLIPVLGVNFGHLGFLTSANREDVDIMIECLKRGDYNVETRTLLRVELPGNQAEVPPYVLNEVYVHRPISGTMLRVRVYVDGQYLANYSGDGLIVATPTGSTAYSLSCGGPILTPDSGSLVITPIGAHTLTLRPIVLSDQVEITLCPEETCKTLMLGTDSSSTTISGGTEVRLRRHEASLRLIRLPNQNFFTAIRHKLLWGAESKE